MLSADGLAAFDHVSDGIEKASVRRVGSREGVGVFGWGAGGGSDIERLAVAGQHGCKG